MPSVAIGTWEIVSARTSDALATIPWYTESAAVILVRQLGHFFPACRGAMSDVTRILSAIDQGDPQAAEQLLPLVYDELRRLAAARLAQENPGQTLQATALVHEAYLSLVGPSNERHWNSRGHFFGAAAEAMRRILIMNARRRNAEKRGGGRHRIELNVALFPAAGNDDRLVLLDEALTNLEREQPERARIVKLRFFAGLTNSEAAAAMGISDTTADRYWAYARAWLQREMASGNGAKSS